MNIWHLPPKSDVCFALATIERTVSISALRWPMMSPTWVSHRTLLWSRAKKMMIYQAKMFQMCKITNHCDEMWWIREPQFLKTIFHLFFSTKLRWVGTNMSKLKHVLLLQISIQDCVLRHWEVFCPSLGLKLGFSQLQENFTHILIYTSSELEEQTTPTATGTLRWYRDSVVKFVVQEISKDGDRWGNDQLLYIQVETERKGTIEVDRSWACKDHWPMTQG